MHKSVSPKLVNISKCHLVETKSYLFIYLFAYLFIYFPQNWMVLEDTPLCPTTIFSQALGCVPLVSHSKIGEIKLWNFLATCLTHLNFPKKSCVVWKSYVERIKLNYIFSYFYIVLCQSLQVVQV